MLGTAKLVAGGGDTYAWTPAASLNNASSSHPTASPDRTTMYHVLVTSNNGCSTADSIEVRVSTGDASNGYLVPNAFTPNGDGKNDCFGVPFWGKVDAFSFSIYNRWGERVFHSNNNADCWNGTVKGKPLEAGTYVYLIAATTRCGPVRRKGSFLLIR
jgi:gliding motility-associated-like protein